MVAALSNINQN
jgi:F-type H+-transporting ATPase subunit O